MTRLLCVLAMAISPARPEIVDRIAVIVNRAIITESDIARRIRVEAFLLGKPADFSEDRRRITIDQLINLALLRREMEVGQFAEPAPSSVEEMLDEERRERFPDAAEYRGQLEKAGLKDEDLKEYFHAQLVTERFSVFRFQPGISISDADVGSYYKSTFLAAAGKNGDQEPPSLEEVRDRIIVILTQERITTALFRWLDEARRQARIVFLPKKDRR